MVGGKFGKLVMFGGVMSNVIPIRQTGISLYMTLAVKVYYQTESTKCKMLQGGQRQLL